MTYVRTDGRTHSDLRKVTIVPGVSPYAEGSAEVSFGNTKVLVTASIDQVIPKWMEEGRGGWITAEYGMLPRATHTRNRREASSGKQGGRTLEIQRLIGRALRAAVNLELLRGCTITLDCDVLVADGGTRTAAVSGGWVALRQALHWAAQKEVIPNDIEVAQIAAVSVGMVQQTTLVDLCYEEDSTADFDMNLVYNQKLQLIEVQGTAERAGIGSDQLSDFVRLGQDAVLEIMTEQRRAIAPLLEK